MDDPALIQAALDGDESAFEALIRAFSRRLYAVAFGILQNAAEAEDVVQDTFLRAWRDRRRIREPAKLSGWLIAAARNRACDVLRRRRNVPLEEDYADIPLAADAPGTSLDAIDRHRRIRSALSALPDHYRVALSLRYLEGMDCRSVEAAMGLTSGALRGILARALESLRHTLKPQLQEG